EVFRHAIGEVIRVRIAAEVGERQHDDRETRRLRAVCPLTWKEPRAYPPGPSGREKNEQCRQTQHDPTPTVRRDGANEERGPGRERYAWNQGPIRSDGLLDVLELPLARIHESDRQLAADVIVDRTGHEHATGPADERQDHALMRLEVAHRGGLVLVHEPAVAGDIGGKNGGEPTVEEALLGHVFSALAGARQSSVLHTAVRIARTVLLDETMELLVLRRQSIDGIKTRNV